MSRTLKESKQPAIQTKIVLYFGGFFHQIKCVSEQEVRILYNPLLKNGEIGGILVFSGSEL